MFTALLTLALAIALVPRGVGRAHPQLRVRRASRLATSSGNGGDGIYGISAAVIRSSAGYGNARSPRAVALPD
jgi:hypothetical protein